LSPRNAFFFEKIIVVGYCAASLMPDRFVMRLRNKLRSESPDKIEAGFKFANNLGFCNAQCIADCE